MTTNSPVARLTQQYSRLIAFETAIRGVLSQPFTPEIEDRLSTLRQLERDYLDKLSKLYADDSLNRIDITGSIDRTLSSSLVDDNPAMVAVHVKACKEAARRLYSKVHPDKGGTAEDFDLVRKAAQSYDLEYLYLLLIDKTGDGILTPEVLTQRLSARFEKVRGSPLSRLASLCFSNSPEFHTKLLAFINLRIVALHSALLSTPKDHSHDNQPQGLPTGEVAV